MTDKHRGDPTLRFAPELPFPPYSYVTGRFPHPIAHPDGHSFGHTVPTPPRPQPDQWRRSQSFCFAVDLFNHGYYWEAHEAWESLWHACGRRGTEADFFKALIKLAAAGVKAREGRAAGWRRHLLRAHELLAQTQQRSGANAPRYFGLPLMELMAAVDDARENGPPAGAVAEGAVAEDAVRIVFPFKLLPH